MSTPEYAIAASSLVREYKNGPRAVDDVSLVVSQGEIYGFLGPNGAGKTTMVKMLVTLLPPSSGTAIVGGHDIVREGPRVRRLIGVALQEAAIDPLLTGRELLLLQAGLHGFGRKEAGIRAAELLERVALSGAANRKVGGYSGGMKRRLDLALALVHSPRIIFLDEPTTGLDPQSRSALWDEVARLARDEGVTVFLTTQYLEEADVLADRVAIIDSGKIVAEGTPDALKAEIGRPTVEVTPALRSDMPRISEALARFGESVAASPEVVAVRLQSVSALADIVRTLDSGGLEMANLTLRAPTLDDVFLAKTGRPLEEQAGTEPEAEAVAPETAAPPQAAEAELRMAAAGRSKIERVPTEVLKEFMASRHVQAVKDSVRQFGTPSLSIKKGPLAGTEMNVDGQLVVGREGDLCIADPEISRRHAVIRVVDGSLVLDDLQSLNGTWVNGKRIEFPTLLAPGDVIALGKSSIEVVEPRGAPGRGA